MQEKQEPGSKESPGIGISFLPTAFAPMRFRIGLSMRKAKYGPREGKAGIGVGSIVGVFKGMAGAADRVADAVRGLSGVDEGVETRATGPQAPRIIPIIANRMDRENDWIVIGSFLPEIESCRFNLALDHAMRRNTGNYICIGERPLSHPTVEGISPANIFPSTSCDQVQHKSGTALWNPP